MNKILPCFGVALDEQTQPVQDSLVATLTGWFADKKGSYNNNPMVIGLDEDTALGATVNPTALLRRVFISAFINRLPAEDVPTHILFVGSGDADIDETDLAELTAAFERVDYVTPQLVFKNASDADLVDFVANLIGATASTEEPVPPPTTKKSKAA
jgi:hypothetical protein